MPRILLVEDEQDIRNLIALHLKREGFQVDEAADGEEGMRRASAESYDLLVLDWMLPRLSGVDITKSLHQKLGSACPPILMVTARAETTDIVLGLEAGADDYLSKPFEIPVLVARVRALLRRAESIQAFQGKPSDSKTLQVGEILLKHDEHEVICAGHPISLTPYEFKLLSALLQNAGRVLTREKLIDLVQGSEVVVVDRAIDTHVFGLRKKLGACSAQIETIRGVGYRVRSHAESS